MYTINQTGHPISRATLPPCLIVMGPTASGKSALALHLAERFSGMIINADAMQCYRELRILTARPSEADEARLPHRLYGTLPASAPGNVSSWRTAALAAIADAHAQSRLPILCGGTFLYIAALTDGLAEIPAPGDEARSEARRLVETEGAPALHARLAEHDPDTASGLNPTDTQRVARAWEIWRATGQGLRAWQRRPGLGPAACRFASILLRPDRARLHAAIERRFDAMLAAGALAEAADLADLDLLPTLPLMRAHGVPDLLAHLDGALPLDQARARAITATLRYTRRQQTWLRHRQPAANAPKLTIDNPEPGFAQQLAIETWVSDTLLKTQA